MENSRPDCGLVVGGKLGNFGLISPRLLSPTVQTNHFVIDPLFEGIGIKWVAKVFRAGDFLPVLG